MAKLIKTLLFCVLICILWRYWISSSAVQPLITNKLSAYTPHRTSRSHIYRTSTSSHILSSPLSHYSLSSYAYLVCSLAPFCCLHLRHWQTLADPALSKCESDQRGRSYTYVVLIIMCIRLPFLTCSNAKSFPFGHCCLDACVVRVCLQCGGDSAWHAAQDGGRRRTWSVVSTSHAPLRRDMCAMNSLVVYFLSAYVSPIPSFRLDLVPSRFSTGTICAASRGTERGHSRVPSKRDCGDD